MLSDGRRDILAPSCPTCGQTTVQGQPFCMSCGTILGPAAPCAVCGADQPVGTPYCDQCGAQLHRREPASQTSDAGEPAPPAEVPPPPVRVPAAVTRAEEPEPREGAAAAPTLTLRFPNGGQFVPEGDVVDIGRTDPSADWRPELDVLPFGGAGRQMGVSRHHARLVRRDGAYLLIDVGSRNGTYLNGRPLEANKPVELKDGDVVAFGAFNARVAVQPPAEAPAER